MAKQTETLSSRLRAVMEAGELTPADLSVWLGRGYQTVYCWVYYDREPQAGWRKDVYRRLEALEKSVARAKGPLVPYGVKQAARGQAIAKIMKAQHGLRP